MAFGGGEKNITEGFYMGPSWVNLEELHENHYLSEEPLEKKKKLVKDV